MTDKKHKKEAEERLLRDVFLPPCRGCGRPIGHLPFCMGCGEPNPNFSKDGFAAAEGQTIEESLRECRAQHILVLRDAAGQDEKTRRSFLEMPYCGCCGELIYTEERIARAKAQTDF